MDNMSYLQIQRYVTFEIAQNTNANVKIAILPPLMIITYRIISFDHNL